MVIYRFPLPSNQGRILPLTDDGLIVTRTLSLSRWVKSTQQDVIVNSFNFNDLHNGELYVIRPCISMLKSVHELPRLKPGRSI